MPLTCSPPALVTRPATVDDIPLLRDLAERIWRVAYAEIISSEQIDFMLGWMYSPEQIARELGEGGVWELGLVDGQAVGFFSLGFSESPRVKLQRLYLLPERQGTGLGQALLNRVHDLAAVRRATEIFLQVNKHNTRAIRAYQRSGYLVERSAVFDIGNGFVMDDFIMQRVLVSRPAA